MMSVLCSLYIYGDAFVCCIELNVEGEECGMNRGGERVTLLSPPTTTSLLQQLLLILSLRLISLS